MTIIGVSGLAGSGKDTVADFIIEEVFGVARVSLADPMKRICRDVYDFSEEQLWGPSEMRNKPDKRYPRSCKECGGKGDRVYEDMPPGSPALHPCMACHGNPVTYLTPREALQKLGTEWARHCYEDTWVEMAIRTAKTLLSAEHYNYSQVQGLRATTQAIQTEGVVIPDVRFRNEIKCIKEAGGVVFRVRRSSSLKGGAAQHLSETEQAEIPDSVFDLVIDNQGSLDDLRVKVSEIASRYFR